MKGFEPSVVGMAAILATAGNKLDARIGKES
jgi:hypothetical protein